VSQPAPPLVFDHTAIVALFGQRGGVVHYWERALPIGHVVHEAMSMRGIVVTGEPNAYRDAKCALLPL
jgi:hypothetical protein